MRQVIGQNDSCSFYAFTFSVTLHILVLGIASGIWTQDQSSIKKAPIEKVVFLELRPEAEQESIEVNASPPSAPKSPPIHNQPVSQSTAAPAVTTASTKQPASLAAPSAPSAEDWAFAARYTNKNSKGYRYNWGQQVRSLMGTAVEGPDQGVVRFRVEIAPDGSLAQLVTLRYHLIEEMNFRMRNTDKLKIILDNESEDDLTFITTNAVSNIDIGLRSRCELLTVEPCAPDLFLPHALKIFEKERVDIDSGALLKVLESKYNIRPDNREYYKAIDQIFRNIP